MNDDTLYYNDYDDAYLDFLNHTDNHPYVFNERIYYDTERITLEELDFSIRTHNCLKRAGIATVGELIQLDEGELKKVRNLGNRSLDEIKYRLDLLGHAIRPAAAAPIGDLFADTVCLTRIKAQIRQLIAQSVMRQRKNMYSNQPLAVLPPLCVIGKSGQGMYSMIRLLAGGLAQLNVLTTDKIQILSLADLKQIHYLEAIEAVKARARADVKNACGQTLYIACASLFVEHYRTAQFDKGSAPLLEQTALDAYMRALIDELNHHSDQLIAVFGFTDSTTQDSFQYSYQLDIDRRNSVINFKRYGFAELVDIVMHHITALGLRTEADGRPLLTDLFKVQNCDKQRTSIKDANDALAFLERAIMQQENRLFHAAQDGDALTEQRLKTLIKGDFLRALSTGDDN